MRSFAQLLGANPLLAIPFADRKIKGMKSAVPIGTGAPHLAPASIADGHIGHSRIECPVQEGERQQDREGLDRLVVVPEDRADPYLDHYDHQAQCLGKIFLDVEIG